MGFGVGASESAVQQALQGNVVEIMRADRCFGAVRGFGGGLEDEPDVLVETIDLGAVLGKEPCDGDVFGDFPIEHEIATVAAVGT
ncbi:hypothetical protein ACWDE9_04865 [Streptomyces olivaceoviridis]